MATNTYYSPFFPSTDVTGAKGTTKAAVPSSVVGGIQSDVTILKSTNQTLVAAGFTDYIPPNQISGLTLSTGVNLNADGSTVATLTATWNKSSATDIGSYNLEIKENTGNYVMFTTGVDTSGSGTQSYTWTVRSGQTFTVHVRGVDRAGNIGQWSTEVTLVSGLDNIPPAAPTNLAITTSLGAVFLSWNNPPDLDVDGVVIYEGNTSTFANAVISGTVAATPNSQGRYSKTGIPTGTSKYYWVAAFDTSKNYSGTTGPVQGTTPSLILADFTPGLVPPKVLNSLTDSGFEGQQASYQGKIYIYTSGTWKYAVNTADLQGTIDAAKLTGGITSTQITDGAISTPKLAAGAVTTDQIAAGTIKGGNIAALTIQGTNIAGGSISADKIVSSAITTDKLAAGAITASKLGVLGDGLNKDPLWQDISTTHNYATTSNASVSYPYGILTDHSQGWYWESSYSAGQNTGLSRVFTIDGSAVFNTAYRFYLYNDNLQAIQISYGKTYEISAIFYNQTNQNLTAAIECADINGNILGNISVTAPPGYVGTMAATATVPQNTVSARPFIYNQGTQGGASNLNGYAYVGNVQVREQLGGTMIIDGTLTAAKIQVGTLTGDRFQAGTITGNLINSATSLPGSITVDNSGFTLATMQTVAQDPAAKINASTTQITPGKVLIGGSTTLSNWIYGGDNTSINGGAIATNTITANRIMVGARQIQFEALNFTTDRNQTVSWSGGNVIWMGDDGNFVKTAVSSGTFTRDSNNPDPVYVWWNKGATQLFAGQRSVPYNTQDDVQVAVYYGYNYLTATYGRTIVDGDYIKTGTIYGDRIIVNSLNGNTIQTNTLTGDAIIANTLDAAKITAGTITTNRLVDRSVTQAFILSSGQTWNGSGVSGGTTGGGGGGGGSACPEWNTWVLLANTAKTGPGAYIFAGSIKVGDFVWTQHEHTMEWGAFEVVYAKQFEAELWSFENFPRATDTHPMYLCNKWIKMGEIGKRSGIGTAVHLTVDQAHTFVSVGVEGVRILNHNKTISQAN